jgi:rhamnosyltransferase
MSVRLVSIVLPTRNGASTLPAVLEAIARQRFDLPVEVVAVDSSSTDGTQQLLRARADCVITIAKDAFDHGLTRNIGVERARGELVVMMVQDAVPASDSWLASLVAPLRSDEQIAGAYARQLPRPDASPLARHHLSRWAAACDRGRTSIVGSLEEFEALEPRARFERCAFDNVCSCIRRSVWAQHPFRPTPIAEDVEWARGVLLAGYRLVYVPEAAVIHSHDRSVGYEFARTYVLHRRLFELFRLRTIPTFPLLIRAFASTLRLHLRWQRDLRGVALALAWPLGQYLGALSAARGWKIPPPRGV